MQNIESEKNQQYQIPIDNQQLEQKSQSEPLSIKKQGFVKPPKNIVCSLCLFSNDPFDKYCFKCKQSFNIICDKKDDNQIELNKSESEPLKLQKISSGFVKPPKNKICSLCQFSNDPFSKNCMKCKQPLINDKKTESVIIDQQSSQILCQDIDRKKQQIKSQENNQNQVQVTLSVNEQDQNKENCQQLEQQIISQETVSNSVNEQDQNKEMIKQQEESKIVSQENDQKEAIVTHLINQEDQIKEINKQQAEQIIIENQQKVVLVNEQDQIKERRLQQEEEVEEQEQEESKIESQENKQNQVIVTQPVNEQDQIKENKQQQEDSKIQLLENQKDKTCFKCQLPLTNIQKEEQKISQENNDCKELELRKVQSEPLKKKGFVKPPKNKICNSCQFSNDPFSTNCLKCKISLQNNYTQ